MRVRSPTTLDQDPARATCLLCGVLFLMAVSVTAVLLV
jgi:hypothetical protein